MSCFPLLLHDTLLTPFCKIGPLAPATRLLACKSAIIKSPFTVIRATSGELTSPEGAGFGMAVRKVTPLVGMENAGWALGCDRLDVSYIMTCGPLSVAKRKALSAEQNAICVGRAGRDIFDCGSNGFVLTFSLPVGAEIALRIFSVVDVTRQSGPAPTTTPLVDATAKREDVGDGSASSGHGVGSNRTLQSPETPLKPISYILKLESVRHARKSCPG